jgi:hypothetical protein
MELGRASWRLCALAFPSRNPDLKAACLRAPALTLLITLMFSPVNYTNTAGLTGENTHLALGRGCGGRGHALAVMAERGAPSSPGAYLPGERMCKG